MEELLNNDWDTVLQNEFQQPYFQKIKSKYQESVKLVSDVNLQVFPKEEDIFRAFRLTSLNDLKVVVIGQDPYHSLCSRSNVAYANGLSFSIQEGCETIPKSLQNMFKELKSDCDIENKTGDLTKWAERGVLMLNTQLSVVQGNANSHKFWNKFTDNIIKYISENCENILFVIWGNNSLKKSELINKEKHHLFVSSHPSPLSAYKGLKHYTSFFGSKVFSRINDKLTELGKEPIEWSLSSSKGGTPCP